jgi:hypothetical protein
MMTAQPDSQHAGTPAAVQEKALRESLEDASVLLWFATREGRKIDDGVLNDIVGAQSVLREGARNPEVEGRFWAAFRELAKAVQPASIDSILAMYSYPLGYHHNNNGKRRLTDAAATKKKYSFWSVVVLISLLIVQIWWFIGTTWRADLETNRAELDRIGGSLREMLLAVKATDELKTQLSSQAKDELLKIKDEQLSRSREDVAPFSSNIDSVRNARAAVVEQLKVLAELQGQAELSFLNVKLRGDRVENMLDGNAQMLAWWDFFTNLIGALPAQAAGGGAGADGASNTGARDLISLGDATELRGVLAETETAFVRERRDVEVTLVNSKSALAILSQYLLPLLYGLLGSLAYILRTLSSEIQNVTFTRGSEIRYALRWPLGMLGGVTVGLFFDPADLSGIAAITPLGLAFLAGYGVELLFTGLDRLVSAFTGGDTARAKPAQAA